MVERDAALASSCASLRQWSARQMRGHIEVRFKGENGVGAGVMREWLTVLSRDLFDQVSSFFISISISISFSNLFFFKRFYSIWFCSEMRCLLPPMMVFVCNRVQLRLPIPIIWATMRLLDVLLRWQLFTNSCLVFVSQVRLLLCFGKNSRLFVWS